MMKRFITIFISISILVSPLTAMADVVMGNDFLYKNGDKTIIIGEIFYGKRFYVNGPSGYVIPKEEPGSDKGVSTEHSYVDIPENVFTFKNGEIVRIERAYLYNGEYWGVMSASHAYQPTGWFRMDELLMIYEYEDFEKENQDQFYTFTGSYDNLFAAEKLVLWQWPGSDREKRVLDFEGFQVTNVSAFAFQDKMGNTKDGAVRAYKDDAGREWIYALIEYTYSGEGSARKFQEESWVCLSEPENSAIAAFNPAPNPIKWSPDGTSEWIHTDVPDEIVEPYQLFNITKLATYEPSTTFTDVPESAWYKDAVTAAYEYGIIAGKDKNIFDPDGSLSFGEALAMASRVHAFYKYGKKEGARLVNEKYGYRNQYTWWAGAAQYCIDEGLISKDELENIPYRYEIPISRAQMVHVWAQILQPKDMMKQNTVSNLPDVRADTEYAEDILLFYEAGIIGGIDAQGTFKPDRTITRAEAAAIFMNLIDKSKRYRGMRWPN